MEAGSVAGANVPYNQSYWSANKYKNIRQTYDGYSYHSRLEAQYAAELDLRVRAKDIKSWERQYKVSLDVNGKHICNYFVDFRILHNDDSYELVEIKGMETNEWKLKRRLLEAIYLPEHPDTIYSVIKQQSTWRNFNPKNKGMK